MEQEEKTEVAEVMVSIPEAPHLESFIAQGIKFINTAYAGER